MNLNLAVVTFNNLFGDPQTEPCTNILFVVKNGSKIRSRPRRCMSRAVSFLRCPIQVALLSICLGLLVACGGGGSDSAPMTGGGNSCPNYTTCAAQQVPNWRTSIFPSLSTKLARADCVGRDLFERRFGGSSLTLEGMFHPPSCNAALRHDSRSASA